MEDKIINLVIAMNQRRSILGLRPRITEEPDHIIKVRYLPHQLFAIHIHRLRLRGGNASQRSNLPIVEARRLAETGQTYGLGIDAVEFGKGPDRIVPPESSSAAAAGLRGARDGSMRAYISVLSCGETPGNEASSIILPSRNSII